MNMLFKMPDNFLKSDHLKIFGLFSRSFKHYSQFLCFYLSPPHGDDRELVKFFREYIERPPGGASDGGVVNHYKVALLV